jgi:serine protease Do
MRGEVIGVNSQIATSTGDYNGIGFALPANEAAFVYKQIMAQGRVRRGYLGIFLDSVKSEYARVYGLQDARGAIVMDVRDQDGPAAKAGIQANDVIVEFNGQPVENAQDLINKVASTPVGQSVTLAYLREINNRMERRTANVTVGERPPSLAPHEDEAPDQQKRNQPQSGSSTVKLGLTLAELTPQMASENHLVGVRGLFVKDVDPSGILMDASPDAFPLIREGDVITRINRVPVSTLAEFQRVVDSLKPGDPVVLNVSRWNHESERVEQRIVQFTYQ